MSSGQPASPGTLRSILVDSSRRKSDRAHTNPDEFSSGSRPPMHSQMSRMFAWTSSARSILGCCVLITVLLVLLVVLLFPRSRSARHHSPCWSPPCRTFTDALAASINASRDPCQDFHGYVCDRWRASFGGSSMLEDAAIGFRRSVRERMARISPPRQSQNSHEKAVMLYKSCLAEGKHAVGEFKQFLRDRRLPWPRVDKRARLMEVVMDLVVNWHFPIFFYAYLLVSAPVTSASKGPKPSSALVVFTEDFLGMGPHLLQKERQLRKNNAELICRLRDALKEPGDDHSEPVSCEQLDQLQMEVLGGLTATTAGDGSPEDESWTAYKGIYSFAKDLTPSVAGRRWWWLLTRHDTGANISPATVRVEVRSRQHMRVMGSLLSSSERQIDLLRVAGLCVVQGLGRFVNSELAALIYGDDSARVGRHSDLCYGIVDQMLPSLLYARYIALLLDSERVAKSTEVFQVVKQTVVDWLRRAAWLNEAARSETLARINRSGLTFEAALMGEATGTKEPSQAAAASLPDFGDNFIENLSFIPHAFWDDIHRGLATASSFSVAANNSLRSMHDPMQMMLLWGDIWRQHNASAFALSSRNVILPNLYMLESVFPAGAYESVNYGVVGSLLARQLVEISFTSAGGKSSESRLDYVATNGSVDCVRQAFLHGDANGTESTEDLEDLDGMLVAVTSLKPLFDALTVSPGYPDWSQGFEEYSAEQLFFLALCFPSCGLPENETTPTGTGLSRASWCNVPLKLFDTFGEAFHCSPAALLLRNREIPPCKWLVGIKKKEDEAFVGPRLTYSLRSNGFRDVRAVVVLRIRHNDQGFRLSELVLVNIPASIPSQRSEVKEHAVGTTETDEDVWIHTLPTAKKASAGRGVSFGSKKKTTSRVKTTKTSPLTKSPASTSVRQSMSSEEEATGAGTVVTSEATTRIKTTKTSPPTKSQATTSEGQTTSFEEVEIEERRAKSTLTSTAPSTTGRSHPKRETPEKRRIPSTSAPVTSTLKPSPRGKRPLIVCVVGGHLRTTVPPPDGLCTFVIFEHVRVAKKSDDFVASSNQKAFDNFLKMATGKRTEQFLLSLTSDLEYDESLGGGRPCRSHHGEGIDSGKLWKHHSMLSNLRQWSKDPLVLFIGLEIFHHRSYSDVYVTGLVAEAAESMDFLILRAHVTTPPSLASQRCQVELISTWTKDTLNDKLLLTVEEATSVLEFFET
ncbi:hypothetical protein MTO96_015093 [Rhipicephalus appendiculatus]